MSSKVQPIPQGFHSVTPYLHLRRASEAIEFYKKAFGASERFRLPGPDGKIAHAEITIGDSIVMLADESEQMSAFGPEHYGGTSITLMVYVDDVDSVFAQAVAAGAKVKRPLEDQFYGDRTGGVEDPFGHHWYLATHIRDVSPQEMEQAMTAMSS